MINISRKNRDKISRNGSAKILTRK